MELAYEYSHLTNRQFAEQVFDSLKQNLGVDLLPLFNDASLSSAQKLRRTRAVLLEAVLDAADRDPYRGEFAGDAAEDTTFIQQVLREALDIEPNLALTESDARFVMNLEGDALKTYLFTLTKRFENMAVAKTPGILAVEMVAGGLVSVGVPAAWGAIQALRAGSALLPAVRAGITGIGMKTVVGAVVVVLAALLLYLFLENPKKILGMVVNDVEENFVVTDWEKGRTGDKNGHLYMAHGEMVDFMQDNEHGLDSPTVQIRGKVNFGAGDADNVVFAGVYFADRNFGLRGSEGVMVFTSKTTSLSFAHMFAVPYFQDNGANIALVTGDPGDMETLFRTLYDARGVNVEKNEGGYRLRARVDNATGGVVGCIASISKTS